MQMFSAFAAQRELYISLKLSGVIAVSITLSGCIANQTVPKGDWIELPKLQDESGNYVSKFVCN